MTLDCQIYTYILDKTKLFTSIKDNKPLLYATIANKLLSSVIWKKIEV